MLYLLHLYLVAFTLPPLLNCLHWLLSSVRCILYFTAQLISYFINWNYHSFTSELKPFHPIYPLLHSHYSLFIQCFFTQYLNTLFSLSETILRYFCLLFFKHYLESSVNSIRLYLRQFYLLLLLHFHRCFPYSHRDLDCIV